MLMFIVLVVIIIIAKADDESMMTAKNLTAISWSHATNSQELLTNVLKCKLPNHQ